MKPLISPEEFVKLARSLPREERVPYAFEKRIMAHLREAPGMDAVTLWAHALWRAAAPCLGIMIIAAAVCWPLIFQQGADNDVDLESAVLAPTQLAFDLSR